MILRLVKRWVLGDPPLCIEHPVLGVATLVEPYWEVETTVHAKPLSLRLQTVGEEAPTVEQVEFFRRFTRDPDTAFDLVRSLLVPEYEEWLGKPFPTHWTAAFDFVGMSVPLAGCERNPWDVSFECIDDPARHLFSCHIENGKPSYVSIDG